MNLDTVIQQVRTRAVSATVPVFSDRVGGAAQFKILPEASNLPVPAAYVIPLADQPKEPSSLNGYRQGVREQIAVVVVLSNLPDERGQAAAQLLDTYRQALFRALLGWQPADDYDAMVFDGGQLLHLDRARLYYQFEFSAEWEIGTADTFIAARDDELPSFEGVNLEVDMTQPFDPNRVQAGATGPDETIDAGATIDLPQEP
jgi:hypothetical protein